jgi:hypothetical protein
MNLHAMVAPLIGRVNPFISGTLRQSTGYTTAADGTQIPQYRDWPVSLQVQELTTNDLQKLDGLNIQGIRNGVYLNGNWNGVVRASREGGDILLFDGQIWLVAVVVESWPNWTRLGVVQQS